MVEGDEYFEEAENDYEETGYDEVELSNGDEDNSVVLIVQKLLLTPKLPEKSQRHSISKTRCTINKQVCDVIIDSESSKNIVSRAFIKALKLQAEPHPKPYKSAWIKKGSESYVTEICNVPLLVSIIKTSFLVM